VAVVTWANSWLDERNKNNPNSSIQVWLRSFFMRLFFGISIYG